MKIKSKTELIDFIDQDLAWRKKELSYLLGNIQIAKGTLILAAIRTAVVLLYAHWEGFIKNSAEAYLCFVKSQKLNCNQLSDGLLSVALKQKMLEFEDTNKSTVHIQFICYFRNELNKRASISEVVNTKSNLNSEILREILLSIGIDFTPFELKSNLIDKQLLNYRNTIAHGQYLLIDKEEYESIHQEIFSMINIIRTNIENAAINEEYKV